MAFSPSEIRLHTDCRGGQLVGDTENKRHIRDSPVQVLPYKVCKSLREKQTYLRASKGRSR